MANFGKLGKFAHRGRLAIWALASAWLLLAFVGLFVVALADVVPDGASHLARWPASSGLSLSSTRATLLVFIHPQCPCSTATLAELEHLVAHDTGRLDVQIVVFLPEDAPDGWRETAVVKEARAIPGAHLVFDVGGREGQRFGATTSGQALLFEPGGEIVFRGGITVSRGHQGESDGRNAIEAIVAGRSPLLRETSVFGCAFAAKPEKTR